jgi:hypothetical protein
MENSHKGAKEKLGQMPEGVKGKGSFVLRVGRNELNATTVVAWSHPEGHLIECSNGGNIAEVYYGGEFGMKSRHLGKGDASATINGVEYVCETGQLIVKQDNSSTVKGALTFTTDDGKEAVAVFNIEPA